MMAGTWVAACSDDYYENESSDMMQQRIELSGEIEQVATTRVNDNGFCNGDEMGVYVVDYVNDSPGILQNKDNRATNVKHTFDEENYKWTSAYDIFWKDSKTKIDVYGYYPFSYPENVNSYIFSVQKDQSAPATEENLGAYEASDFLWGKAVAVAPTGKVIRLPMCHRMSSPRVTLLEGDGFDTGEWEGLKKQLLVSNTIQKSEINLADGKVTPVGEVAKTSIIPYVRGDEFRAIVVPQTIKAGLTLFTITVNGVNYTFKKEIDFEYVSGKMHNFSIKVSKKAITGDFTFKLVGESITAWENDNVSHDATMKEYIVIHSEAGKLKEAIAAANKNYRKVKNLKITGEINGEDFYFMRDSMEVLQSLNMKEVKIAKTETLLHYKSGACRPRSYKEDEIPEGAMHHKKSLMHLVLPDQLKIIHVAAFEGCENLVGSLNIPEGVTKIRAGAFVDCTALSGSLSLPKSLKSIGDGFDIYWYGGAFEKCGFTCQLIFPPSLEYIGQNAFEGCNNLYGELHLPESLKKIEYMSFRDCENISGSLRIPQGVTMIPNNCFEHCGFDGTLSLHDGILAIGEFAFNGTHFRGEINLPKELVVLSKNVFNGCDFSGVLKLPEGLRQIGNGAFANNWRLMGVVEFPEGLLSIGAGAFAKCRSLEGLVFPESMESIRYSASPYENGGAFQDCFGIGSIVCKGTVPPIVQKGAFHGIPKDNFTLEVPESAIQQYHAAVEWNEFKRIAAHRELVCRPSIATAINTECTRQLVVDAEGDWEVESKPDWCTLSPNKGTKKTKVTLTIAQMAANSQGRIGEIVFKLKDQDYTHRCKVSQYNYEYAEDEIITLQKASVGKGVNLVFLGDGFDAEDISKGDYMKIMKEQVEHFFDIEPYKTYRNYFNVYTSIAVSPEKGVGSINTIRYNRFGTTYTGGVGLKCDYDAAFKYALRMPTVNKNNLKESLIIMTPNSTDYGGICQMWDNGTAIAFCPLSNYGYPLDTRGVIQHEAGGHGFAKLGDEYIYHNQFIDFCTCTCCEHVFEFTVAKSKGWYVNLSLSGKTNEVPWSNLIYDEKYKNIVDIFEGGYMHSRGVFRSELNSCMNNCVPYYSTISRMEIVKRIKRYAGEEFSYEDFKAKDVVTSLPTTRAEDASISSSKMSSVHHAPVIHKGSPLK